MTVTLIVMEPGGQWPGQVLGCEDLVAVRDDADGLLERTNKKIGALRRRGLPLRVAVLACNEASDAAAGARRADVARVLLAAIAAVGFGRLLLTSPDQPSTRLRSSPIH